MLYYLVRICNLEVVATARSPVDALRLRKRQVVLDVDVSGFPYRRERGGGLALPGELQASRRDWGVECAAASADPGNSLMTILIVEDQLLMRNTLRKFLQPAYPEWAFIEAADGASAMEACAAYLPQVVLMDISLPDIDGIALTKSIKDLLPNVAVIFVSYLNGKAHIDRALAAGGCAYVVKDRLFTDLIPAIENAISAESPLGGTEERT